jgi:hypothetical protein
MLVLHAAAVLLASKEQFAGADLSQVVSWAEDSSMEYFLGIKLDGAGLITAM